MGSTKVSIEEFDNLAEFFAVLSDSNRLRILNFLSIQAGPVQAGLISTSLGLDHGLSSHHLRILSDKNFIRKEKVGRFVLYKVVVRPQEVLEHAESALAKESEENIEAK